MLHLLINLKIFSRILVKWRDVNKNNNDFIAYALIFKFSICSENFYIPYGITQE